MVRRLLRRAGDRLVRLRGGRGAFFAGDRLMKSGKWRLAAQAFADAEEAFTESQRPGHEWTTQARAYRAWCYGRMGDLAKAVELYERVIAEEKRIGADQARIDELEHQLSQVRRMR